MVKVKEVEAALATTRRTTRSRKSFWFLTKIAIILCFCQVWQAEKGERGRGWQQLAGSKVKGGLIYSTGQLIVEWNYFFLVYQMMSLLLYFQIRLETENLKFQRLINDVSSTLHINLNLKLRLSHSKSVQQYQCNLCQQSDLNFPLQYLCNWKQLTQRTQLTQQLSCRSVPSPSPQDVIISVSTPSWFLLIFRNTRKGIISHLNLNTNHIMDIKSPFETFEYERLFCNIILHQVVSQPAASGRTSSGNLNKQQTKPKNTKLSAQVFSFLHFLSSSTTSGTRWKLESKISKRKHWERETKSELFFLLREQIFTFLFSVDLQSQHQAPSNSTFHFQIHAENVTFHFNFLCFPLSNYKGLYLNSVILYFYLTFWNLAPH